MTICSKLYIFCGIFGKLGMIRGSIIKNWTVGQVHHFANADFHITKTILQDDTYAHTNDQVTQIFPHQGGAPSMVYFLFCRKQMLV
jgi:hypothetical protein